MTRRQQGYVLVRAVHFRMVCEPRAIAGPSVIRRAEDAATVLREYIGSPDREHFVCLTLNTAHQPTGLHTVSIGGLASAPVHPREVFKFAVRMSAAGVIIGHNHPSGSTTPSREDIQITEQLRAAGRLLGIEVLDHIIVGESPESPFTSLRDTRQGFP